MYSFIFGISSRQCITFDVNASSENLCVDALALIWMSLSCSSKISCRQSAYSSAVSARKPVLAPLYGIIMSASGPPVLWATVITPAA